MHGAFHEVEKAIYGEPKSTVSDSVHRPFPWVLLGVKLSQDPPQFRGLDSLDYCMWIKNKGPLKVHTK